MSDKEEIAALNARIDQTLAVIDQDQDQDKQIAALQLRISGLEKDLTALSSRGSNAKIALMEMRAWFDKNPKHPDKGRELERLEQQEQLAMSDFYRIAQALEKAKQQLIEAQQRIEA